MRTINGVKLLSDRRRDPSTGKARSFGTKLVTPEGQTYRVFEFPQKIADVKPIEHGLALTLKGGSQRILQSEYDQLTEAACASVSEEYVESLLTESEWDEVARESLDTARASTEKHPLGKPGGPGLWHHKGMELPPYIQNIAKAIMEKRGIPLGQAIAIARGATKRWASGRGKVHSEVRAAAAKTSAEWDAKRGVSKGLTAAERAKHQLSRSKESATTIKAALRDRETDLAPLLESWLGAHDDSRPVQGSPEELREAGIRASSGSGPLSPRSDIDRRVLLAQRRIQEAQMQPSKSRTPTPQSLNRQPVEQVVVEEGRVFVQLPPERGTAPQVQLLLEGQLVPVGEYSRIAPKGDLEDLQEQATELYRKTADFNADGRASIQSAGRNEIGQLINMLEAALAPPPPLNSPPTPSLAASAPAKPNGQIEASLLDAGPDVARFQSDKQHEASGLEGQDERHWIAANKGYSALQEAGHSGTRHAAIGHHVKGLFALTAPEERLKRANGDKMAHHLDALQRLHATAHEMGQHGDPKHVYRAAEILGTHTHRHKAIHAEAGGAPIHEANPEEIGVEESKHKHVRCSHCGGHFPEGHEHLKKHHRHKHHAKHREAQIIEGAGCSCGGKLKESGDEEGMAECMECGKKFRKKLHKGLKEAGHKKHHKCSHCG